MSWTCEWIPTVGLGGTHHMTFGVLDDKISHLVQEHRAQVVLLQEVVRRQPGVLCHVVRQLQRRPALVHVDCEDVIVFLENRAAARQRGVKKKKKPSRPSSCPSTPSQLTFPSYITLLDVCWLEPPTTSPIFCQRPSLTLH